MRILNLIICLLFISTAVSAQSDTKAYNIEEDLLFFGDAMVNGLEASTRIRAAEQFEKAFDYYLEKQGSLDKSIAFTKFISILPSPNKDFNLVSWLIREDKGNCDYKGYLIFKEKVVKLKRWGVLNEDLAYTTSNSDNWYGSLYYNIMPYKKSSYLIYGFDASGKYDDKKIVDVLTVDNQTISFGAPVFEDKTERDTYLNRLILTYSSDAAVLLNYNPGLKMIVHDHLEPRMGQQPGQGPTNIPDGTYEGYELKKGLWIYKEKIFDHIYEEAPRPKPVFNNKEDEKNTSKSK